MTKILLAILILTLALIACQAPGNAPRPLSPEEYTFDPGCVGLRLTIYVEGETFSVYCADMWIKLTWGRSRRMHNFQFHVYGQRILSVLRYNIMAIVYSTGEVYQPAIGNDE